MHDQTRRQFLAGTAVAAAGLLSVSRGAIGQEPDKPVQISIARWKLAAEPGEEEINRMAVKLTEQAVANLGGMKRFVKNGDVVWIKPNIGFVRPAQLGANSNPDVIATLVRLCLDAGAKKVRVGDNSCYGAQEAYPASGIEAAVKAVGGEIVYLDPARFKMMQVGGERIREWLVYSDMIESDLLINAPVAKKHGMTKVSLCLKNYMGVVAGPRNEWHTDMPTCLTDIAAFMKPRLTVLDAVRVLLKNGPLGMKLSDAKVMGQVAAGTDVVGLEAFGAELLGHDPQQGKTMAKAQERGLGHVDYRSLVVRDQAVG